MTLETAAWAMRQTAGNPVDKFVLFCIADYADMNSEWVIEPSKISRRVEMTEGDIEKSIKRLESLGLVMVSGKTITIPLIQSWIALEESFVKIDKISKSVRKLVYERDGYLCTYCGSGVRLSVDHRVPRSRGGGDEIENLTTACCSCNSRKSTRTEQEYRAILEGGK